MEANLAELAMLLDKMFLAVEPAMSLEWLQKVGDQYATWCSQIGGSWVPAETDIGGTHQCNYNVIGDGANNYFEENLGANAGQ